ncbi:hypothetical protein F4861DRAFT_544634 [Xylaria intraflava]|nr:hypothetical protein F4861DRAFT_544634 [Xylaria intraflava]
MNVDEATADLDSSDPFISKLTLKINTIHTYISAIQRLYEEQKSLGLNLAPMPQGMALKALKESILRQASKKQRAEYEDRGIGTLKDTYPSSKLPEHTSAVKRISMDGWNMVLLFVIVIRWHAWYQHLLSGFFGAGK